MKRYFQLITIENVETVLVRPCSKKLSLSLRRKMTQITQRDKSTFWHSRTIKIPKQRTERSFYIESFTTSRKLSIGTLMNEIKPAVIEEYGFEYRNMSMIKDFFWCFQTFKNPTQEGKNDFQSHRPSRAENSKMRP